MVIIVRWRLFTGGLHVVNRQNCRKSSAEESIFDNTELHFESWFNKMWLLQGYFLGFLSAGFEPASHTWYPSWLTNLINWWAVIDIECLVHLETSVIDHCPSPWQNRLAYPVNREKSFKITFILLLSALILDYFIVKLDQSKNEEHPSGRRVDYNENGQITWFVGRKYLPTFCWKNFRSRVTT